MLLCSVAGSANVLEIICIDTANKVPGVDGKSEDEVLGRTQINIDKLKLDEKAFVEDWFELQHIDAQTADEVVESDANAREALDTLTAYLKLEVSSTLDKPEIVEMGLGSFQLDNQDEQCDDPVVISPEPSSVSQEYVTVRIARCTSLDGLTSQLEHVDFHMAPTSMCINWEFLAPLMEFAGSLPLGENSSFDGVAELCRQMELVSRFDELAATSTAKPTKIYAKQVQLSNIKLTATTKMKQLIKQMGGSASSNRGTGGPLLSMLFRLIATVGVNLVEIVEAPIMLDSLSLPLQGQDPFTTQEALIGSITAHVIHQAVLIGLRILGSTATIQGGTKLVGSVLTGLEELGTGFRGLTDGDVVGVGVGVLGLGKNVAGGGLNAVNSVLGLVGDVMGTNAITRNTVGALIGVAQKGLSEVSDAIDGTVVVTRNRATRNFGLDDEILVYSSSITLGNKLLRLLQQKGQIPAWVAEHQCLSSVFLMDTEHDRSFVTLVTSGYVLQLVGPTNGHRRPTTDVLDSLKLVGNGSTSLSAIHKVYLESGAVCLKRTHACNYARNELTDAVDEERIEVEDTSKDKININAADASMLEECFEALTQQLKAVHPLGAYAEHRAPLLTVSVQAADGLPKGRHAPKVVFVVQVPGAHKERYISAGQGEDISPTFDEAAQFVMKDYHMLAKGQGVTLEIWDRNVLSSDDLVGTAILACTSSLNPLPTTEQLAKGATWSTDGIEEFVLENTQHKDVGTVRVSMALQPRKWSWEHKLSMKMGVKAVLSQVRVRDSLNLLKMKQPAAKPTTDARTPEDSPETKGSVASPTKSGWLRKYWSGAHFTTQKRWFVLAPNGSLSYAESEHHEPKHVIPAGGFHSVHARQDVKQIELTCANRNNKKGVLVLEATDAAEALEWKLALDATVAQSQPTSGGGVAAAAGEAQLQPTPQSTVPELDAVTPAAAKEDVPSRVAATIWSAHDLPARDVSGKSDPYVELRVVSKAEEDKTKTKSTKFISSVQARTTEPLWDPPETFHCVDNLGATEKSIVRFKVWDRDVGRRDELLGVAEMPLLDLLAEPQHTLKKALDLKTADGALVPKKNERAGQARLLVTVRAFYNEVDPVGTARALVQMAAAQIPKPKPKQPSPSLALSKTLHRATSAQLRKPSGAKIHLRVLSATNSPELEMSMSGVKTYVQLAFRDDRPQRTTVVHGTRNPSWLESEEEQHQFMVPVGAWKSRLRGSLWHRASIPPDDLLATFELAVSEVQLEVSVVDIRLTPADETLPMAPGEVPTVRVMCVRTEPAAHDAFGDDDDDADGSEGLALSKATAAAAKRVGESLVDGLRNAVDDMASANAARSVADLCYETSTEGPLRRKAFIAAGGVESLVAILHVNSPTSVVGKWVAEALRALVRKAPFCDILL
jgi:hypothetical protein